MTNYLKSSSLLLFFSVLILIQTRKHRLRVDPISSRSFKIKGLIRGVERRLENNGDYFFVEESR